MSWGVMASGKLAAVAAEIDKQLDNIVTKKYVTDVAELRQIGEVRQLISNALADFVGPAGLEVSASGSLSQTADKKTYTVIFSIKPFYNWVE